MNLLKDFPFKIFGQKLTKSEGFNHSVTGEIIWDGENKLTLLGQFKDIKAGRFFAENVKNNTSKKSWRIELINDEINLKEEIGYVDRENFNYKKPIHVYQK